MTTPTPTTNTTSGAPSTRHTPRPIATHEPVSGAGDDGGTAMRDPIGDAGTDVAAVAAVVTPALPDQQPGAETLVEPAVQTLTGTAGHFGAPSPEEIEYRGWFDSAVDWVKEKAEDTVDIVVDQAKDFAKDKIDDVVGAAAGAAGGYFGGPAGAAVGQKAGSWLGGKLGGYLFRGADGVPLALDLRTARAVDQLRSEQAQVEAMTREVLEQTVPVIADAMYTEYQGRKSRGVLAPADDEAVERFWGALAPTLASYVLTECFPQAVKGVSQNLGTYTGSRSTEAIDPLMVDTETALRFGVPVLGAVLASVQACVAELYAFIEQGGRPTVPRDAAITWDGLLTGARLHGGDRIAVLELTPAADPGTTEFVLELPPQKGWWKGLHLADERGTGLLDLSVDGSDRTDRGLVSATTLQEPGTVLHFVKADADGLRKIAYRLPTGGLEQVRGRCVHFYWYAG